MTNFLFFDNASTTPCIEAAAAAIHRFSCESFGNPSSGHALGQEAAKAIREARFYFAETFRVEPSQVIFTGSGSEADNLAIYGVALAAWARTPGSKLRVLASAIEHPAVRKTVQSLSSLGIEAHLIPVERDGQIRVPELESLLAPETLLVSIQQVNNIMGAILPVQELAQICKKRVPHLVFHTDAVQAFGKVSPPSAHSGVDLLSVSGHKVHGPKGVGALIVLNRTLLKGGLRPMIWGGEQEGGFRSGTQNAGLISGFHLAARDALARQEESQRHVRTLRDRLREQLIAKGLLSADSHQRARLHWNSPEGAIPNIVSLSAPGFPSAILAKLLEERGCLVSTGSACSSQKAEPDPVLNAMGHSPEICQSAIRISFSSANRPEEVDRLAVAIEESMQMMARLLKPGR